MKVMTKPLLAEAWQVTHDQGWWETFKWLSDHDIDASMIITTQRPEEDRFTIYTDEGPLVAYTYDWIVVLNGAVSVHNPNSFEQTFEYTDTCSHLWCDWIKSEERYECESS